MLAHRFLDPREVENASEQLLPFPSGCVLGRLVRREKRFFIAAQVKDELVWAHTNNTGSMLGLLRPGAPVLLSPASNPERKLRWTLELVWCGGTVALDAFPEQGFWAGVNTSTPNRLLEAAFRAKKLPWATGYTTLTRERTRGASRLDALLEGPGLPRLWVECKNVTLAEDDVALFPDAVSSRGRKHLEELKAVVAQGERGAMFYLVQRPDGQCFAPADTIDPAYAQGFYEARAAGVEIYPHRATLSTQGIDITPACLSVLEPVPFEGVSRSAGTCR